MRTDYSDILKNFILVMYLSAPLKNFRKIVRAFVQIPPADVPHEPVANGTPGDSERLGDGGSHPALTVGAEAASMATTRGAPDVRTSAALTMKFQKCSEK